MKKLVRYYKGPFSYTVKNITLVYESMYEDFNKRNAPVKRIGVRRKQNGLAWMYYKEFFEGEENPAPAPEFFELLKKLVFKYPEKLSFWHVEEVDDNGNVIQSLEASGLLDAPSLQKNKHAY